MEKIARLLIRCLVGVAFWAGISTPAPADDFYAVTPADLQGPPGSLIRFRGMDIDLTFARVYRILYRSTGLGGETIPVSGLVQVPNGVPPAGGWPVIAWAHPTTGIARDCAPTVLFPNPITKIPGINRMLLEHYVVAATDYPGLGIGGPHPYLVGISEGRAVLDSVRAARDLQLAHAGDRYVVWGHSQGGQAALFTGELSNRYAPELTLLGIAAAAPATELGALFEDDLRTLAGKILGGMVIESWSKPEVYDAPPEPLVVPSELPALKKIGEGCIDLINITGVIGDLLASRKLPTDFTQENPTEVEPWKSLMARNTPGGAPAGIPLFIAQGTADDVVDPPVTVNFVKRLCAEGSRVLFVEKAGVTHHRIAKVTARQTLEWIAGRFAGELAPDNCGG